MTKEIKQGPIMTWDVTDSLLVKHLFLGDEINTIDIRTILARQKNKYSQLFKRESLVTKWQPMTVACKGLLLHVLTIVKDTMRWSVLNQLLWKKRIQFLN